MLFIFLIFHNIQYDQARSVFYSLTLIWVCVCCVCCVCWCVGGGGDFFIIICFKICYLLLTPVSCIGQISDRSILDFRISGQSLIKINCHKSRTSDDTEKKLQAVTKPKKRNKTTPKEMMMTSCWETVTSLPFFQFTTNLEQSGGWIMDA